MSNAKKFSANGTDIDVQKFLNNIDSNTESYISQMNWGAKRANAFRTSLNQYKAAIANGNIAQRNAQSQYVDSTGTLSNQEQKFKGALGIDFLRKDRDINGDVASFLDTQLNPMIAEKINTPKQDFNPDFMGYFNTSAFGNNQNQDWDAWSAGEQQLGKGKHKVLDTSKRVAAFKNILTNYKNKIEQDDSDYNWGNYGDKNQFLSRINNAINGLNNGLSKEDYATLSSLGITSDIIKNNLFNTNINKAAPTTPPVAAQPPLNNTQNPKVEEPVQKTVLEKLQEKDELDAQNQVTNSILAFRRDLQKHGWGNVAVPVTGTAQPFSGKVPTAQALAEQMKSGSSNIDLNRTSIANAAALYFSKYANQEPNAYLGTNAQGQKEYIVPYTPNKNGTFVVYNQSTGSIRQVPISNYLKYNDTKNPKFAWLAKYIYRHENGGVIKNQDGGVLAALKAKLNTYDSLEQIRKIHPKDLPAGFVFDPTARQTTEQQYNQELAKANTAKSVQNSKYDVISPKMSGLLSLRNIANATDLASIPAAFIPGVGTVTSGVLGGIGTIANFAADLNEGVPLGKASKNLLMNTGMTFASMIPGLAATRYAKYANALKNVKGVEAIAEAQKSAKLYKNIRNGTMVAAGAPLAYNTVNNIAKVYDDPTKRNWGNLLLNLGNDALFARGIKYRNAKIENGVPGSETPKGGTEGGTSTKNGVIDGVPNGTANEGTNKPVQPKEYTVREYDANGNPVNKPPVQPTEPVNNPKPEQEIPEPTSNPEPAQTKKPSVLSNVLGFAKKHKVATTVGATTAALAALNSARAQNTQRHTLADVTYYGNALGENFNPQEIINTDVNGYSIDPKTGALRLYDAGGNRIQNRPGIQHTVMVPELVVTGNKSKVKNNRPVKHAKGGIINKFKTGGTTVGNGGNPKSTWLDFDKISSTYNKIFPDVSAAIRTIGDINTNNTIKNQMLEGMHATLYNPFSVHHGIYGDLGTKQGYYQRAAEMEYQPQPVTSDANLQLASNLERKNNADKYRFQGDLENNRAIAGNTELANKYNMQNTQMQNEIANKNMQSMNATNQARTQLNAQTTAANRQSIDTYLEQQEYRRQANNDKIKDLEGNNMQDWLQNTYFNTPKARAYQQALTNYMSIKGNTDITKAPQYKAYLQYQQQQTAAYKNKMNEYLRQVYPGYNPLKFTVDENTY